MNQALSYSVSVVSISIMVCDRTYHSVYQSVCVCTGGGTVLGHIDEVDTSQSITHVAYHRKRPPAGTLLERMRELVSRGAACFQSEYFIK